MFSDLDKKMMRLAIEEAQKAASQGDVPVGAVVAMGERVIAVGHNTREAQSDPTGHAEINAIRAAARQLGGWRLTGATLYVTLEPCAMCAGAIVQSRIARVVYGTYDRQAGCCASLYRLTEDPAFNHFTRAEGGLMETECEQLMRGVMDGMR